MSGAELAALGLFATPADTYCHLSLPRLTLRPFEEVPSRLLPRILVGHDDIPHIIVLLERSDHTTTSLHGSSTGGTQYNGLGKYWKSLGESPGETALRPDRVVLKALKAWMKYHHPEKYWELYEAKRENGQPLKRSANERARVFCYQKLGIDTSEFRSGHNRGIYFSRLYQNTDAFLRGEIDAADLKPKFDNSPEALTAYWRQKSRSRVQKLAEQGRFSQDTYFTDELVGMSWDDAKQRYLGHAR